MHVVLMATLEVRRIFLQKMTVCSIVFAQLNHMQELTYCVPQKIDKMFTSHSNPIQILEPRPPQPLHMRRRCSALSDEAGSLWLLKLKHDVSRLLVRVSVLEICFKKLLTVTLLFFGLKLTLTSHLGASDVHKLPNLGR